MRATRFALIALAFAVVSVFTARPASAAAWQLCLRLATAPSGNDYFMNFVVQGNAILVAGQKNVFGDDHGPLFGSMSRPTNSPFNAYEMGLTVTFENMGDYNNQNTENVVFQFLPDGHINFKKWIRSSDTFTQGEAVVINCPGS